VSSRGGDVYAVAWDADGKVTETVTTVPKPGVRFALVKARPDQKPKGKHYDGEPANLSVGVDDSSVAKDSGV